MVLSGRNEGLVFCRDAVLQFGIRERYYISLHRLCLGSYCHILDAKCCVTVLERDWPGTDSKSASLSPYPSSRSLAVSPGQVAHSGVILSKSSPKQGAASPISSPTSVKQKYWQDQALFCISLSTYDLIANAWGCATAFCSGGDYWTPCSELKTTQPRGPGKVMAFPLKQLPLSPDRTLR